MDYLFEKFSTHKIEIPYANQYEQLEDYMGIQNILLNEYIKYLKSLTLSDTPFEKYKGLVISKEEVDDILHNLWSGFTIDEKLAGYLEALEVYIEARTEKSIQEKIYLPFVFLSMAFRLNDFEKHCLIISLMPHINKHYEKIFAYAQDDVNLKHPTLDLCIKLNHKALGISTAELYYMLKDKIFRYILLNPSKLAGSILNSPIKPNDRILQFLFESGASDFSADYFYCFFGDEDLPPFLVHEEQYQQSLALVKQRDSSQLLELIKPVYEEQQQIILYLKGDSGAGRKFNIKKLAQYHNKNVMFVDMEKLYTSEQEELIERLQVLYREANIQQAFICLEHADAYMKEKNKFFMDKVLGELNGFQWIFVLTEEAEPYSSPFLKSENHTIVFESPRRTERRQIWEYYLTDNNIEGIPIEDISDKFELGPGKIVQAIKEAMIISETTNKPLDQDSLYSCCYHQILTKLKDKASLVYPIYTLKDLVLPTEAREQIIQVINQVKYRGKVYDEWGFEKKLSYGKGLNVLFAGPPGTGKTMAAQVIAKELKIEMYKIDLSQVVSKYIGETEQNLNMLFNEAKKSNVVLFFDETDALLGKRSEVKDAHDKYANLETSFLLQKIEEYEGIVIMATNYMQNIDDAFMRRIHMIIHFPFPSVESRTEIWRNIFPQEMPSGGIDYDYLGRQFELSGGSIKNIALMAAFLAAEAEKVTMAHILKALRMELTKQGKALLKEDFGQYYYLLSL